MVAVTTTSWICIICGQLRSCRLLWLIQTTTRLRWNTVGTIGVTTNTGAGLTDTGTHTFTGYNTVFIVLGITVFIVLGITVFIVLGITVFIVLGITVLIVLDIILYYWVLLYL